MNWRIKQIQETKNYIYLREIEKEERNKKKIIGFGFKENKET